MVPKYRIFSVKWVHKCQITVMFNSYSYLFKSSDVIIVVCFLLKGSWDSSEEEMSESELERKRNELLAELGEGN